jgi:polar amino acid transport system substrate-binding protein
MTRLAQKISMYLIFILLLTILGCHSPSADMDKKHILVVGLAAEYPPFEYQHNGEIMGFDVDLIQAIGQQLGKQVQIQDMSFHNLIGALQNGKIDIAISGMQATPERQKSISFSSIYYQPSLAIVHMANMPLPPQHSFTNKKIGVQLGSTMEKWIKKESQSATNVEIIALDANPPLIEKLKLGQIDYVIIEALQAKEYCQANPHLTYQTIAKSDEGYAIAIAKDSAFLAKINQAIADLTLQGELQKLQQKWKLD